MKKILFLSCAALAMLCACTGGNKFNVSGKVEGAADSTSLYLEVANNGSWFILDSTTTSGDGYSISYDAPEVPNIYRLRCADKAIYFTVDSIESLTIDSKLKTFDLDFNIDGTDHAKQICKIEKDAILYAKEGTPAAKIEAWKKQLAQQILADEYGSGIVAYFIINKYLNGQPLFDPMNDADMKIIGAVANAFNSYRKDDPRTQYLVNMTLEAQKRRRAAAGIGGGTQVEAEVVKLFDINLQDCNGAQRSLAKEAQNGRVILLNFTMYDQSFSPAFNKVLNDLYTQYKDRLTIFQVGLDQNLGAWRDAAKNIPWIAVYDPAGENSKSLQQYQVFSIPTSFIIDRNGEIQERIQDPLQLKSALQKYL
ncbi:MAG: thioredoxin-like domain-containing protein [Bacteroidales bacterium]|nr:thioredoxin-like domain-containing protein [Bacteroidales bacterium]